MIERVMIALVWVAAVGLGAMSITACLLGDPVLAMILSAAFSVACAEAAFITEENR